MRGYVRVIVIAVARPIIPPPMIVRAYCEAIGIYSCSCSWFVPGNTNTSTLTNHDSNVKQCAGIFFRKAFHLLRIRLLLDGGKAFFQRSQPAAVIGTEDDSLFAHPVY